MDKSIVYKEAEKYIYLIGALSIIVGGVLKFLLNIRFGVILFWGGFVICHVVSALDYPKKSEILGLNKQSTTTTKIMSFVLASGAFLILVGAVLTILRIPVGKWLINIGLIPMFMYIIWYSIIILKNWKNKKNNET